MLWAQRFLDDIGRVAQPGQSVGSCDGTAAEGRRFKSCPVLMVERSELERIIRDRFPPPADPLDRQAYEDELRDWLDTNETERTVIGFGQNWTKYDTSLSF